MKNRIKILNKIPSEFGKSSEENSIRRIAGAKGDKIVKKYFV